MKKVVYSSKEHEEIFGMSNVRGNLSRFRESCHFHSFSLGRGVAHTESG